MENNMTESSANNMNPAPGEIYNVSFKTKAPARTHTFWFTDLDMAAEFNESLLMHPKVIECHVYAIKADLGKQFIKDPEIGGIAEIETWERGRGVSRRKGSVKDYGAAKAAERTKT